MLGLSGGVPYMNGGGKEGAEIEAEGQILCGADAVPLAVRAVTAGDETCVGQVGKVTTQGRFRHAQKAVRERPVRGEHDEAPGLALGQERQERSQDLERAVLQVEVRSGEGEIVENLPAKLRLRACAGSPVRVEHGKLGWFSWRLAAKAGRVKRGS